MTEFRTFLTQVTTVVDVHPTLRCITFAGEDLRDFEPVGPDTFLFLLLPPPGRDELTIGSDFSWEAALTMSDEERPVGAYYTLRHWRPEQRELDLLVVLHDPSGPAATWAARAAPGDPAALWGPRTTWQPPEGTETYLLVADETGLPAVAVILETLPAEARVHVVAEAADTASRQDLPDHPGAMVTWWHRDGAAGGSTTLLVDAVRRLELSTDQLYAWGGAESRAMTAVRRHLRGERAMPAEAVSMVAYWRHALTRDHEVED